MLIDPASLGATLYLPATRGDLAGVILSHRHHDLRSVVICLEDAVAPADVPTALLTIEGFLARLCETPVEAPRPHIFVRPRDHHMLGHILTFAGIERVDGFVIPKATAQSMPDYLGVLASDHHLLMPTLETREVFDPSEMRRLREQLIAVHERILAIRIGGNDLLQTIGARRSGDGARGDRIHDLRDLRPRRGDGGQRSHRLHLPRRSRPAGGDPAHLEHALAEGRPHRRVRRVAAHRTHSQND